MASRSIIAARKLNALRASDAAARRIAEELNIDPMDEIPRGVRNPDMREVIHFEMLQGFMDRVCNAVMDLATAPDPKKGKSNGRK